MLDSQRQPTLPSLSIAINSSPLNDPASFPIPPQDLESFRLDLLSPLALIQMQNPISEVMCSTPPGVGFHPTDNELLTHYLKRKNLGQPDDMIPEIDVLDCEPENLHSQCGGKFGNKELLFFYRLKPKYSRGKRSDRTAKAGFWKPTDRGRTIKNEDTGSPIGEKRTLAFHKGRRPNAKRTSWLMYEYRLSPEGLTDCDDIYKKLPYVVCRINNTKGKKPMMGHAPTPVNQEGDDLSFRDNQETSVEEAMESLPSLQLMDDNLSNHTTNPAYQPQAGADQGSSSFLDFSYDTGGFRFLGPIRSPPSDFGFCHVCYEDLSTTTCIHGRS